MKLRLVAAGAAAVTVAVAGSAAGHGLDHPVPSFSEPAPLASTFNSGGDDAEWELVDSIPTGNPHTDLDFFTQAGETYASVGTLGIGPNGGGQTIIKLTDGGEVAPSYVTGHPSASCLSNPVNALGLQHDVEATPKGGAILNSASQIAAGGDAQLIIDATDADGRCHDQGDFGLRGAPQGGLEIVDVTKVDEPVEIGLTSHIGEAHTVNVDPKRPHIAYAVTSDAVGVNDDGTRQNEDEADTDRTDLDGFEIVDLSSCLNFPAGTTVEAKREACRPQVFRYRYPSAAVAQGHTSKGTVYGCHELEIYPDDRITCGSGAALLVFDVSGAFDDNGTPTDFTDDKPRGTPLPCRVRPSSSADPFGSGAMVTDCVTGERSGDEVDLRIPNWIKLGSPSLEGIRYLGSIHHMGRGAEAYGPKEDVDFNHEAELTGSGRFLLATDERGGGVVPPGASCSPGVDNPVGNGGIHAYRADALRQTPPADAEEAFKAYARTPAGEKAVFRAPINTQPQATVCTAHVFQQIPGQNRIFMGWYSQGTQVVDFVEHPDGTLEFKHAGYFIPENANTWVSHVFKVVDNGDGTFTYYGATGDFNIGAAGRNAIDVYKVTLPAPPKPLMAAGAPASTRSAGTSSGPRSPSSGGGNRASSSPAACTAGAGFARVSARPRGRALAFFFTRNLKQPVSVDVLRASTARRVGLRRVASFANRTRPFRWSGRGRAVRDGYYVARFRIRTRSGIDERRVALRRRKGRFQRALGFERRPSCGVLRTFSLSRPVFGGRTGRSLPISFRLNEAARVTVVVKRGNRTVKRFGTRMYRAGRTHRLLLRAFGVPRGTYTVALRVVRPGRGVTTALRTRRL